MRLISRPAPEPAVTGEESRRAALPWAAGPLGWRAALTAECGFHAAQRLHRLVWAAATLERAPAATDRSGDVGDIKARWRAQRAGGDAAADGTDQFALRRQR